jgi:sugar lactone lactonase YvrE
MSIEFSPDGSNVYILGDSTGTPSHDQIIQCRLTTPWDLSTLVFPPNLSPYSVSTQESVLTSVTFKPDGSRMYIVGETGDDINEYSLSQSWNPGSATFIGLKSLTGETLPQSHAWSTDGGNVYVVGTGTDNVRQYSVSVPWTVANLNSTAIAGFSVASQEATPNGLTFKPDGTIMYVIGSTGDDVNEYSLSTAWDISTASFVRASASLSAQTSTSQELRFNSDGTILYTVGTSYVIYTYNLSTAWDVSTITFNYAHTPVYGSGAITGIHFSDDGHYFYITTTSEVVIPFYLRTPWDLLTSSYQDRLIDAANFEGTVGTMSFKLNTDGSKIYIQDQTQGKLTEYSLSESYNISSVSSIASFNSSPYSSTASAVYLDSTNSNIYLTGDTAISVLKMSESSNLQTAYASQRFDTGSNLTVVTDMYVSPSGNAMFCSNRTGIIYKLNMSAPFDVDSLDWSGDTLNITAQESGFFTGMTLSPAGDKVWVIGGGTGIIFQYTLSTPWNLASAVFTRRYALKWPVALSGTTYEYSLRFYDNGYKFYLIINHAILAQYNLQTAYDLGSVIDTKFIDLSTSEGSIFTNINFVNNGYTLLLGSNEIRMFSYQLTSPYDISSIGVLGRSSFISSPTYSTDTGIARYITSDDTYVYSAARIPKTITRHVMLEPGNIYSAIHPAVIDCGIGVTLKSSYIKDNVIYSIDSLTANVRVFPTTQSSNNLTYLNTSRLELPILSTFYSTLDCFDFKPDGTKLFVLDTANDQIVEYTLSSPWNINSGLYITNSFSLINISTEATPNGLAISKDGKNFYIVGSSGDVINQFSSVIPWDINYLTITAIFSVSGQESLSTAIQFDDIGTNMYVIGTSGDDINQYSLSTAWDISTASFVRASASLGTQDATPQSFVFKPDGTRVYVRGSTNRRVSEYTLSTPWDVSTISYSRQLQVSTLFTGLGGMAFKPDGKKMYLGDTTPGLLRLVEYDLGS